MEKNQLITIAAALIVVVAAVGVGLFVMQDDGGDGGPSEMKDAMNNNITPLEGTQRIVCTTVTATEMVCDLGLRSNVIGSTNDAGIYDVDSEIIGIDMTFDYPASMEADIANGTVKSIGGATNWTADFVASLNPTVVVAETYQFEADTSRMTQLQTLGITVIVLSSDSGVDTMIDNYELLGFAFDKEDRAEDIADAVDSVNDKIQNAVAGNSAIKAAHICYCFGSYYIYNDSTTMGVLEDLGCEIVLRSESSFGTISAEQIADADPDVIIFDDMATNLNWEEVVAGWKADPVMGAIDVIAQDDFFCLEYGPFKATSYNTVHFVEGKALIAAMIAGDSIGVDVPNVLTDENWKNYIQWIE